MEPCLCDWPVKHGGDNEELPVGREYDHGRHTVGLIFRIPRISLLARRELAFVVDRHQPEMVERLELVVCV
jgi:hypothetical protein